MVRTGDVYFDAGGSIHSSDSSTADFCGFDREGITGFADGRNDQYGALGSDPVFLAVCSKQNRLRGATTVLVLEDRTTDNV